MLGPSSGQSGKPMPTQPSIHPMAAVNLRADDAAKLGIV
jgi:hypothetical protein